MFFCKIKIIFGKTNLRNDLQNYTQFIFCFFLGDPELPWSQTPDLDF